MARRKDLDSDGELFRQVVEKKLDIRQKPWGVRVIYGCKALKEYCDVEVSDYDAAVELADRLVATRAAVIEALFELNKIEKDVDVDF